MAWRTGVGLSTVMACAFWVAAVGAGLAGPVARSGTDAVASRIPPPAGFRRLPAAPGSFAAWLRELPLRPGRPRVLLYDGRAKVNQSAHQAVVDIDVGAGDLQQCADAVIRLRAEYLRAAGCADDIRFSFTSGDTARWSEWRAGARPHVDGGRVRWARGAAPDTGYGNFRSYLDVVFTYAGTASLARELPSVRDVEPLRPGEVFVQGGSPGHAVIVLDVAENRAGEQVFLLAQSFMPAQDIHVLRSFDDTNPWYRFRPGDDLRTPEWDFSYRHRRRFRPTPCEQSDGGSAE